MAIIWPTIIPNVSVAPNNHAACHHLGQQQCQVTSIGPTAMPPLISSIQDRVLLFRPSFISIRICFPSLALVADKFEGFPRFLGYDSCLPGVIRVGIAAEVSVRIVELIVATQHGGRTFWSRIQLSGAAEMSVRVEDQISTARHSGPNLRFLVQLSGTTEVSVWVVYLVDTARHAEPTFRFLVQMAAAAEVGFSEI